MSLHHNTSHADDHFDFKIVDAQWPKEEDKNK